MNSRSFRVSTLTATGTSYQVHIEEVWDKWHLLKHNKKAECRDVRAQVQHEYFSTHGLGVSSVRPAGPAGMHTQGRAFDAIVLGVNKDALAGSCGLTRPLGDRDSVHYVVP